MPGEQFPSSQAGVLRQPGSQSKANTSRSPRALLVLHAACLLAIHYVHRVRRSGLGHCAHRSTATFQRSSSLLWSTHSVLLLDHSRSRLGDGATSLLLRPFFHLLGAVHRSLHWPALLVDNTICCAFPAVSRVSLAVWRFDSRAHSR